MGPSTKYLRSLSPNPTRNRYKYSPWKQKPQIVGTWTLWGALDPGGEPLNWPGIVASSPVQGRVMGEDSNQVPRQRYSVDPLKDLEILFTAVGEVSVDVIYGEAYVDAII